MSKDLKCQNERGFSHGEASVYRVYGRKYILCNICKDVMQSEFNINKKFREWCFRRRKRGTV